MYVVFGKENANVLGAEAFEALLEKAAARLPRPTMVQCLHGNGRVMLVGVGRPESVVCFKNGYDCYTSVGDRKRDGAPVVFEYDGQPSEYHPAMCIPWPKAKAAAIQFLETGEQPSIEWEKDAA